MNCETNYPVEKIDTLIDKLTRFLGIPEKEEVPELQRFTEEDLASLENYLRAFPGYNPYSVRKWIKELGELYVYAEEEEEEEGEARQEGTYTARLREIREQVERIRSGRRRGNTR